MFVTENDKGEQMREIKFRGKSCVSGDWVYGYYLEERRGFDGAEEEDASCIRIKDEGLFFNVEVRSETIGQFTGLKDKNGKEIYEGDILEDEENNLVFEVVWYDGGLMLKDSQELHESFSIIPPDYLRIIGSRFDNPELLEGR